MITVKILTFVLIMCVLNLIKEGIAVAIAYRQDRPYESSKLNNVVTMASIAFILTIIFCGF